MTDNEIIKALECCGKSNTDEHYCEDCPCRTIKYCASCISINALDLINRQKAEIARLKKAIDVVDIMEEQHKYALNKAKAEAIKEFTERLKDKIRDVAKIEFQSGYYYLIGEPFIDNIVEEMAGDV